MIISEIVNPVLMMDLGWNDILKRLDNSRITLDGEDPSLRITFEPNIADDVRRRVYYRTVAALNTVELLSPERDIINKFVGIISFSINNDSNISASNSSRESPGHVTITNPLGQIEDSLFLLESIVHESIHCLLIELEYTHGWLCDLSDTNRVVSPWTGRALVGHSFVHAVVVYHALARMYAKLIEAGYSGYSISEMNVRLSQIVSGFLAPVKFGLQIPAFTKMHKETADSITRIQDSYKEVTYLDW